MFQFVNKLKFLKEIISEDNYFIQNFCLRFLFYQINYNFFQNLLSLILNNHIKLYHKWLNKNIYSLNTS